MISDGLIPSLQALKAMAEMDMGEAALALAAKLDLQQQAARVWSERNAQVTGLGQAYERMTKPGAALYPSALHILARQAVGSRALLDEGLAALTRAEQDADDQRQLVHAYQSRYEGLEKFLREAKKVRTEEAEKRAALEREDLFLSRQHLQKGQA